MIRHYIYILLLLFSSTTFSQSIDKNENSKELKLIISISSFHNAKTEDAQALAEILSNHIKKSKKLNYTFLVETPSTLDEISDDGGGQESRLQGFREVAGLEEELPCAGNCRGGSC